MSTKQHAMQRICVFCGANPGKDPKYVDSARNMGATLARHGIALVFGGGRVGMMGAVADGATQAGGRVIGVIPQALLKREGAYAGPELTEQHVVRSMHERKQMMSDLSDGFIALPGGYGTFEELCEMITWSQLGIHAKPCAVLNVAGYYDSLLALFDHGVAEGLIKPVNRGLVIDDADPEKLIERMAGYVAPEPEIVLDWKSA